MRAEEKPAAYRRDSAADQLPQGLRQPVVPGELGPPMGGYVAVA